MKAVFIFLGAWLCAAPLAWSHDGEDHGAPPPAISQSVAPRASAKSEDFELLLVADKQTLVMYLDSFASNAPVPGAKVEVEGAGLKGVAVEVAPGVYQLPAPALGTGKHALTVSIETADNADLLATTLDVAAQAVPTAVATGASSWLKWAGGAALMLTVALFVAGFFVTGRRREAKASPP